MEKYCKKCKNYKNFKDYHKHKKGQYGLYPICKDCRKTKEEKVLIDIVSKKECKRCLHIFDISSFYKNSNSKDGFQTTCKNCFLEKRSNSQSKIESYMKIILEKFIKINKKKFTINFNENDLIKKYNNQKKKCFITDHEMTHIIDKKGRSDNIYNISILPINDESKITNNLNINDVKLVINLFYSVGLKYNLNSERILEFYKELTCNKCDYC